MMLPVKIITVFFVLLGIGFYVLSVARNYENSEMCRRYGGPNAFYSGGSCWIPERKVDS
jgi:hypothetical protein